MACLGQDVQAAGRNGAFWSLGLLLDLGDAVYIHSTTDVPIVAPRQKRQHSLKNGPSTNNEAF